MLPMKDNRGKTLYTVTLILAVLIPTYANAAKVPGKKIDNAATSNQIDPVERRVTIIKRKLFLAMNMGQGKNTPTNKKSGSAERKLKKRN